ncbi:serine/threonine-protein kinase [Amycolatopsis azurea]|uniref:serine/threonine-protein kinase n=1 Tax=Amycolatopsis azurea TaxID=36819 RepID=UPI003820149E
MHERQFEVKQVADAFGVQAAEVDHLGTGAFGETWRVGSANAWKIIYSDEFPAERLEREVEGLLRIRDPRVVKLHERITLGIAGRPRAALRFEFVPGGGLDARIKQGPLPAASVLALTRGLLHAAGVLRTAQLVHRDIKPANVVLRGGDPAEPVLLDLGLAKPLDASSITIYPHFVGTVLYAAPEQLRGERARNAADLWSIGVVAAQALTGKHPYWRPGLHTDPAALFAALDAVRPELPADTPALLRTVITKLLSPRKAARGSAGTVKRMLDGSATME